MAASKKKSAPSGKLIKKKKLVKKPVKKTKPKKILKKKKPVKKTSKLKKKPVKRAVKKVIKKVKKSAKTLKLKRAAHNPIIKPRLYSWESKATFNPTAFNSGGEVHIVYRAIGEDDASALGYATSKDGLNIHERPTYLIYKRFIEYFPVGEKIDYISGGGWSGGCEDPRLTLIGDRLYMLYTAFDGWGSVRIALTSIPLKDFKSKKWHWDNPVMISPPGEMHKNWVLFPEKINGKFAILHTISPEIKIYYVDSMDEFDGKKFIPSSHSKYPKWKNSWDTWIRGVGPAPIKTKIGWLILYHAMDKGDPDRYKLGALILDLKDPTRLLYHSENPILEPDAHYENEGFKWGVVYSCGAVVKDGELFVYYGGADKFVCVASIPLDELLEDLIKGKPAKLKREK